MRDIARDTPMNQDPQRTRDTPMTGPGHDALSTLSQKRRRGVKVTAAAIVALGLAVGGGAVAGAATPTASTSSPPSGSPHPGGRPPGGARPAAVGTVRSVGTGEFTVATPDGTTVTVDVGRSTTYRDPGHSSPTIADVTVGEHVAVFGTEASDTVSATSVGLGDPPSGGPGGPGGSGGPPGRKGTTSGPPTGRSGTGRPPAGSAGS